MEKKQKKLDELFSVNFSDQEDDFDLIKPISYDLDFFSQQDLCNMEKRFEIIAKRNFQMNQIAQMQQQYKEDIQKIEQFEQKINSNEIKRQIQIQKLVSIIKESYSQQQNQKNQNSQRQSQTKSVKQPRIGNNSQRLIERVVKRCLQQIFQNQKKKLNKLIKRHQEWSKSYAYIILILIDLVKVQKDQQFKQIFQQQIKSKLQKIEEQYKSKETAQYYSKCLEKTLEGCKLFELENWIVSYDHIFKNLKGDKIKNRNYYQKGRNRIQKGIIQWRRKVQ